jgi:hypothetical protein
MTTGFTINDNKGFTIKFENQLTISVQFGYGNYCDNQNHPDGYKFQVGKEVVNSSTAEIAIWDENGNWFNFSDNEYSVTVMGYCTPEEVAMWIHLVSTANDLEDLQSKAIEVRTSLPA